TSGPSGFFGMRGSAFPGVGPGSTVNASVPGGPAGSIAQGSTSPMQGPGGWGQASTTQSTQGTPLRLDLQKLGTDLQAIQDKSQVTPALLAAVRNDVQGLQKESTSAPTQATLTTLLNDLSALNGATPDFTQGTLKSDLEAAIKSAGVDDTTLV